MSDVRQDFYELPEGVADSSAILAAVAGMRKNFDCAEVASVLLNVAATLCQGSGMGRRAYLELSASVYEMTRLQLAHIEACRSAERSGSEQSSPSFLTTVKGGAA